MRHASMSLAAAALTAICATSGSARADVHLTSSLLQPEASRAARTRDSDPSERWGRRTVGAEVSQALAIRQDAFVRGVGREVLSTSGSVAPAVCFILGFFPGFGLGNFVAGDAVGGTTWLIIDIIFVVAAITFSSLWKGDEFVSFIPWILWIVEHVFQGFDAYHAARGGELRTESPDRSNAEPPRLASEARPHPTLTLIGFAF